MRLIDADNLKEIFAVPSYEAFGVTTICSIIDDAPTIEVVKCEYCRWWCEPRYKALAGRCVGQLALWCKDDIYTPKDFFCKYGELRIKEE